MGIVMRICQRGHDLKPENTYVRPNGQRRCKACKQAYAREYYQRNLEKRKAYEREYYEQHRDKLLAYAKRHYRELKERYGGRPWDNKQSLVRREQERRGIKRED